MSADFLLDHDDARDYESWDASGGVFSWVIEVVSDRVRDEELAAQLKEFLMGGYRYFALSFYSPGQAAEIVRVIREDLRAVVDAEHPGTDERNEVLRGMVDELIGMADRWSGAS